MLIRIGSSSPLVTSIILLMIVIPRAGAFLSSFSAQRAQISGRASSIASDSLICTMSEPVINNLKGKVAVVTGASRGIGKGIAVTLGERGCTVYVTGRSAEGATTDKARRGRAKLRVLRW